MSALAALEKIAAVSPALLDAALAPIAQGEVPGEQFAHNPGWVIGHAIRSCECKAFAAAYLGSLDRHEVTELRLGKKADAAYGELTEMHKALDRYAYGPPQIRFTEAEIDQARAAGVLIELDHGTPIITDRALLRELAKQAIERTLDELRAAKARKAAQRSGGRSGAAGARSPVQELEAEHRAAMRDLTRRAHGTNLDLGSALLQNLATVDPGEMDVARFFAYGLLGSAGGPFESACHTVATIAANGIRLVIEGQRTTITPTLKSGAAGKTKVSYGDPAEAEAWLWKFLEGAKSAGELYGRTLVVFAAQRYAHDLVLAASQRRSCVLPLSRKDTSRKAFERICKKLLPASHVQLQRAIEREARAFAKRREHLRLARCGEDHGESSGSEQAPQAAQE